MIAKQMFKTGFMFLVIITMIIAGCKKESNDLLPVNQDPNGGGVKSTMAVNTIISTSPVINGAYLGGVALTASNTVSLSISVGVTGAYTISTNVTNGYSYSCSGTFTSTGTKVVTLLGTGTPAATGSNTFTATMGTSVCTFKVLVVSAAPINLACGGTNYVYYEVANQKTQKVWLDRNLGATRVAQSATDYLAYGSLYQWGRLSDNHQCINWTGPNAGTAVNGITSTKSATDVPGHSKFITSLTSPFDWRNPQNSNLWQGVSGINNPCPAGFRMPTSAEFIAEIASWSSANAAGAFASPLKWVMPGYRDFPDGVLYMAGEAGGYWSSTKYNTSKSLIMWIDSSSGYTLDDFRAAGYSVRPIKN